MARKPKNAANNAVSENTQSANVQSFEVLTVTEATFSEVRKALKEGKKVEVNGKVKLTGFIANVGTISRRGGEVRTPFYYLTEDGKKLAAFQLKSIIGIEPETKGERKKETFANLYERLSLMAEEATEEELQTAATFFTQKAEEKRRQAAEAIEEEKQKLIARLKALGVTIK